jgi:FkbM family methyltransferase
LFVDAGANVGFFSLLAASLGARVIAFEPNPACHRAIIENAAMNGFAVDARMVGLSDAPGASTLHLANDDNIGAGTLRNLRSEGIAIKLDTLANQLTETPAVMKIDVEGSEIAAIKGAGGRLAPIIIMEVSEFSLRELAGGKDELFDLMIALGYSAEIISPVRRSNVVKSAIYFQYDVVFRQAI